MPELPEVETIARTLAPQICGRHIIRADIYQNTVWQGVMSADRLERCKPGIESVGRRGKLLLIYFGENGQISDGQTEIPVPNSADCWPGVYTGYGMAAHRTAVSPAAYEGMEGLAFHLRMTGRLFVYPRGTELGKYTRVMFTLDDGRRLFFDDVRKFGQVRILSAEERASWEFWKKLGPEPLEMSAAEFAERFHSRAGIKSLLLNQSVVAGVGNIYADESLFRAGIRPDTPASSLSAARLERLHVCLVQVLLESIHECGSSIRDYRTARGDAGAFQNSFRVYGRAGQKCLVCGRKLSSCHAGGRTTVFCSRCQKG